MVPLQLPYLAASYPGPDCSVLPDTHQVNVRTSSTAIWTRVCGCSSRRSSSAPASTARLLIRRCHFLRLRCHRCCHRHLSSPLALPTPTLRPLRPSGSVCRRRRLCPNSHCSRHRSRRRHSPSARGSRRRRRQGSNGSGSGCGDAVAAAAADLRVLLLRLRLLRCKRASRRRGRRLLRHRRQHLQLLLKRRREPRPTRRRSRHRHRLRCECFHRSGGGAGCDDLATVAARAVSGSVGQCCGATAASRCARQQKRLVDRPPPRLWLCIAAAATAASCWP